MGAIGKLHKWRQYDLCELAKSRQIRKMGLDKCILGAV